MLSMVGGCVDFLAEYASILFVSVLSLALRERDIIKVPLNIHAAKVDKFFIDSLREPAMFFHVYVHFTRQDQVAIPTDVWMPLDCFVTTHSQQSLLSSAEDKDKFVSDPHSHRAVCLREYWMKISVQL